MWLPVPNKGGLLESGIVPCELCIYQSQNQLRFYGCHGTISLIYELQSTCFTTISLLRDIIPKTTSIAMPLIYNILYNSLKPSIKHFDVSGNWIMIGHKMIYHIMVISCNDLAKTKKLIIGWHMTRNIYSVKRQCQEEVTVFDFIQTQE